MRLRSCIGTRTGELPAVFKNAAKRNYSAPISHRAHAVFASTRAGIAIARAGIARAGIARTGIASTRTGVARAGIASTRASSSPGIVHMLRLCDSGRAAIGRHTTGWYDLDVFHTGSDIHGVRRTERQIAQ